MPLRSRRLAVAILALTLAGGLALTLVLARDALTSDLVEQLRTKIGLELSIAGGVGIALLPRPALLLQEASIAAGPDPGDVPLLRVEQAAIGLRLRSLLRGRLEVDRVRLAGAQISLVRGTDGRDNWHFRASPGAEAAGASGPGGQPGAVPPVVAGQGSDVPHASAAAAAETPNVVRGLEPSSRHSRHALPLAGLEVLGSTLTWQDQVTRRHLRVRDLCLELAPGPDTRLGEETVVLSVSVTGRIEEAHDARLSVSAQLDLGRGGVVAARAIRAQVLDVPPSVGFGAPPELTGELSLRMGGQPSGGPTGDIRFDLALTGLDLDALHGSAPRTAAPLLVETDVPQSSQALVPGPSPNPSPSASRPGPPASREVLSKGGPWLPDLRLEGRLRTGDLRAGGLHLRGLEINALGDRGELRLDHRADDFYGGVLSGVLRIDGRGGVPRLELQTAASGFQTGPLLADVSGTASLTGRGDLAMSLAATGADLPDLLGSLQGRGSLRVQAGALPGVDFGALLEGVGAAAAARWQQAPVSGTAPRTDLEELSASAAVAQGLLRSDDLVARGPWFRLTGSGTLALADGRLDLDLRPVLVKPPQGRGLKELEGVPIPVTVSGTLRAPVWRVDAAAALREAARRRLDKGGGDLMRDLDRRTGVKGLGEALRGLLER